MFHFWLAIIVFLATYVLIIDERIHRAVVALGGGALILLLGVTTQEQAVKAIDFNTIGLLVGMMIIVGITRQSGVFEYAAIKAVKLVQGRPLAIMAVLAAVTAVASALLDNVTTVLLIVPITFAVTDRLKISPIPYLFAEILASNIGGTATLIGDPPNIMIGSAVGLGFMDFLTHLALPVIVIFAVTLGVFLFLYRHSLVASAEDVRALLELDEKQYIKDYVLMKKSLLVLGLTIAGFLAHQTFHWESATVALSGAVLLMLIAREDPEEVLLTIEWPTIFFFTGLFVVVGGLKATGVIEWVAREALTVTGGNVTLTGLMVLWLSAIASAFVDNIPFVATMIPMLQTVGEISRMPMESIWWALALGACLGGNGTLIGASANVIVAGIAERYGSPIGFMKYMKIAFPLMILSIMLSTGYLYLAFWR